MDQIYPFYQFFIVLFGKAIVTTNKITGKAFTEIKMLVFLKLMYTIHVHF